MNRSHFLAAAIFAATLALTGSETLFAQRVAINSTGALPNASALLDVDASPSNDKGLLIPRVSLTDVAVYAPITGTPVTSLLVYNTNAAMTGGGLGYWYWDGTNWVGMGSGGGGNAWLITGNNGITAANFLGPINNIPLRFRTNNIHSGIIDPAGPTFLGYQAGELSTGIRNVGIGYQAMQTNTTGSNNTAVGYQALQTGASSTFNTCVGYYSLAGFTSPGLSGYENTAIGYATLDWLSTGNYNCALGSEAGSGIITGERNIAIGKRALAALPAGNNNVAVGDQAMGSFFSNGSNNVAIGKDALIGSGGNQSNNTCVGYQSDATAGSLAAISNATAIGNGAIANANDKVRIGNTSVTVIEGQVAYTFPSDGRFKANVTEEIIGLDFITRLRPIAYNFDTRKFDAFLMQGYSDSLREAIMSSRNYERSSSVRQTGFIAQEVEKAAQEAGYNFNGVHKPETENDNYSVSYSLFVVPLVKAVQEQQNMIGNLQAENETLRSKLDLQEARLQKLENTLNTEAKK